jgi:hypothetical protein
VKDNFSLVKHGVLKIDYFGPNYLVAILERCQQITGSVIYNVIKFYIVEKKVVIHFLCSDVSYKVVLMHN